MSDAKPKSFMSLELRCACGSSLFVEVPQEPSFTTHPLTSDIVKLGTAWTQAHAAHHQELKK